MLGLNFSSATVENKTAGYLLKSLNCDTSENKLRCLREKSADEIAMQSIMLPAPANFVHGVMRYGVYIDGLEIREGFYDRINTEKKIWRQTFDHRNLRLWHLNHNLQTVSSTCSFT